MANTISAFCDDVIKHYDTTDLIRLIRSGELCLAEVTDAIFSRIERVNPGLHALVYADYEAARKRALFTDYSTLPYAGLPIPIKDNIHVAGMPSAQGMLGLKARPQKKDSAVTRQFKSLGFNVFGKTQISELGLSPNAVFKDGSAVHNPWNTDHTSGASSAGAAALVGSGALSIAHGNDGGGSIRIPAACCGLVGLKPSRARLAPSEASRLLPVDVICEGVLTRSVRDIAYFYSEAEKVWRSSKFPALGMIEGAQSRRMRIGYFLDSITPEPTDQETRQTVLHTARLLETAGHHVEEAPLPDVGGFKDAFILYYMFLFFMQTRAGKWLIDTNFDRKQVDALTEGFAQQFIRSWYRLPQAIWSIKKETKRFRQMFKQYDVLLSPVVTRTTPKIDYLSPNQPYDRLLEKLVNYTGFTPINNASGLPGISLPMGKTSEGLPIGIHLTADLGQESMLISLAYELEAIQPWPLLG